MYNVLYYDLHSCVLPASCNTIDQCFPTFSDLPKIAPRRWVVISPPQSRTNNNIFSQKCPFISVAHPIKRELMTKYKINFNATVAIN